LIAAGSKKKHGVTLCCCILVPKKMQIKKKNAAQMPDFVEGASLTIYHCCLFWVHLFSSFHALSRFWSKH